MVILRAAVEELAEAGYGGVTIEAIATRAGVGKSTIYRHWRDKLELLADAFETFHERMVPSVEAVPAREALERLLRHVAEVVLDSTFSRCIPALIEGAERDPRVRDFHHRYSAERRRALVELIEAGIEAGELRAGVDPESAAATLLGAIFYRRLMTAQPFDPAEAGSLIDMVVGGSVHAPIPGPLRTTFPWDPDGYLEMIRAELPDYDRLQDEAAAATRGVRARSILELGTGSGETARRVLAVHPRARLHGIDDSAEMLAAARAVLAGRDARLDIGRIEGALPSGPFDLVVSALAVHHLDGAAKAALFARVGAALRPGGRFVLADIIVPDDPADVLAPLQEGYDLPSTIGEHLDWLADAGLDASVRWRRRDLVVIVAEAPAR